MSKEEANVLLRTGIRDRGVINHRETLRTGELNLLLNRQWYRVCGGSRRAKVQKVHTLEDYELGSWCKQQTIWRDS